MVVTFLKRLGKNKLYLTLFTLVMLLTLTQWMDRIFNFEEIRDNSDIKELYSQELQTLNSINNLSEYIDSVSESKGIDAEEKEQYVKLIDDIIRKRFYHGQSHISFGDNYIAWILGKTIWSDFSVGVTPDEILSHPNALCSQSAIVFQEIVKLKGFKVRAVGLKRHFCSEVYYEGAWHFMDPDKEPYFDQTIPIPSTEDLSKNEDLKVKAYVRDSESVSIDQINEIFDGNEIFFYNENEFPAKNMFIFQNTTKFLSDFLWLILALPILLNFIKFRSN